MLFPAEIVAENGVRWYAIEAGEQEVIRLSLVFRAGTRFQARPFLASATVNMLAEGTEKLSAQEIAEQIDFYGAYYDVSVDRDYAMVSVCCLSKFLPQMLELLEQVVVHPVFPEEELRIYANKRKQALKIEREKVSYRSRELFGEALYGKDHPYGFYASENDYDTLTVDDLKVFYEKHFTAKNCFAVSSGKMSKEDGKLIFDFLHRLPSGKEVSFNELPAVPTVANKSEAWEGALQSSIRIGKVLFPRNHPDYIGMQVLMMVLGGYFGSRLMSNLREERGYTYGVMSTMVNLESSGYLAIATEVGAPFTADAVKQIFHEIGRLREEPVPAEELAMVKNMITGEFMRILDGPFGIADVTIENIQGGITNQYVNDYLREVKAITPERLKGLADQYLHEAGFVTVVVGKPE